MIVENEQPVITQVLMAVIPYSRVQAIPINSLMQKYAPTEKSEIISFKSSLTPIESTNTGPHSAKGAKVTYRSHH